MTSHSEMPHSDPPVFYHDHSSHRPKYPTQSNPMRYAFIVVGSETIFLCHQIMSHMEGHNYEVVLEVTLPDDTKKRLLEDRGEHGRTHYLANVQEHTLASMKAGRVTGFDADIWNTFPKHPVLAPPWGSPGHPIEPWLAGVRIEIVRVVEYSHVNDNVRGRKYEEYVLFGKNGEAHLYHSIVRQPDYDHVATLASVPEWLSPEQLQAGVRISVPALPWQESATRCGNPLPDNTSQVVMYFGISEYRDPFGEKPTSVPQYTVHVDRTWWYSTRIVNYFNQNPCSPHVEVS